MPNIPARTATHSDLPAIYTGGWLATREQRRAAKEIYRSQIRSSVVAAREVARVDAVTEVSVAALLAASEVSAVEAAMIQRTPHAEARLKHIGDSASAALGNIVLRVERRF
jgi:hypothetical protein